MNKKKMLGVVILSLANVAVQADVAIICNPSVGAESIGIDRVANIYLGKSGRLSDGTEVTPIEQEEGSDVRAQFHKSVTKKRPAQLKAYRSRLLFTGKGKPPKELFDDEEVKELIAKDPSVIGYIDKENVDGSVKILLTIP